MSNRGEEHPSRLPEGSDEMRNSSVYGDDQVEIFHHRGGFAVDR